MKVESLVAGFVRASVRSPSAPALELGNRRVTYQELAAVAWAVSEQIPTTDPGPIVGVLAHRSVAAYAGAVGILLAGRGYVPLHPKQSPARLATLIRAAGVRTIILGDEGKPAWNALLASGELGDWQVATLEPSAFRREDPAKKPPADDALLYVDEDAIAYLMFTSGSTGEPKVVAVTHGNVSSYFANVRDRYRLRAEDRLSGFYDLNYDGSVHDLFLAWDAGACLVPVPDEVKLAPTTFIQEKALTGWYSGPAVLRAMIRSRQLTISSLPTLRLALFTGEPLTIAAAKAWQEAAPHCIIENVYGPTEATIGVCLHRFTREDTIAAVANGIVPIGRLTDGHRSRIIDEYGALARAEADGSTTGELLLTGPQVVHGYYGDPATTAERFLLDSSDNTTWYRTGDRVRLDANGCLHFLGRADEQIELAGHRVDLAEVDHVLREVTGQQDATTIPWLDNNGAARGLIGFVAAAAIDEPTVLTAMGWHLQPHMVPARLFAIPALPLAANGKLDRSALFRLCAELAQGNAA